MCPAWMAGGWLSRELNQRETSHLRLDLITVPSKPTPSLRLLLTKDGRPFPASDR